MNEYKRIWAAKELLKRYMIFFSDNYVDSEEGRYNKKLSWSKSKQLEMQKECLSIITNVSSSPVAKRSAKTLLEIMCGIFYANDLLEGVAIVSDRNDSLVRRWRRSVIKRDKSCVECGSTRNLHAHHISHWCDDPVNRINVNNGVALCSECHSKEHPEMENLILSRGSS